MKFRPFLAPVAALSLLGVGTPASAQPSPSAAQISAEVEAFHQYRFDQPFWTPAAVEALLRLLETSAVDGLAPQSTAPLGRDVSDNAAAKSIMEDNDWPSFGPEDADLTVVTFTDYRCPACLYAAPRLDEAVEKDGRVRLLYRDWPIFGAQSEEAARVAIATHLQGRYVAMHKALMASRSDFTAASIMQIAAGVGIDLQRLGVDLETHASLISQRLSRNRLDAARMRLPGTPGYLIGGLLIVGALQADEFATAFENARKL